MKGAERKAFFSIYWEEEEKYLNLTLLNIHTFFFLLIQPLLPKTEYINSKWQGKKVKWKQIKNSYLMKCGESFRYFFLFFFLTLFECFIYSPLQSTWSYFPPFVTINRWNAIFQHIDTLELIQKSEEKSWPMKKNRHSRQVKMNILIKLRKPHALRCESSLD